MNRNRCSSGRRLEGAVGTGTTHRAGPAVPGRLSRLAGALLLALLALRAAPLAAQPLPEPLNCPEGKELCVQADRTGGIDLKTGVAHLDGNVRGLMRSRDLHFRGNTLTAYRDGGPEWSRLVLEDNVRLQQAGRESDSDHGVLEREEIRLTGNVRIRDEQVRITGHEAVMRTDINRTVVNGTEDRPAVMVLQRLLLTRPAAPEAAPAEGAAPPEAAPAEGAPAGTPAPPAEAAPTAAGEAAPPAEAPDGAAPPTTRLRARQVVLDDATRQVTLSGNVRIEQSDQGLTMRAQHVVLFFTETSELESFRAEGDVEITQPERRIAADFAQSRNQLDTILLVGHAAMQQTGQFELKSDRMEVFTDSSKGIMQSQDRQQPITLTLDLAQKQVTLTRDHIAQLTQQGLPGATLAKLGPLVDKPYPSRKALRDAIAKRLSPPEAERYLDTIVAVTR